MNISKGAASRRILVGGQVMKTPLIDTALIDSTPEENTFDQTMHEIAVEVEQLRLAGRLRPFVEGEAIGVLPRRVPRGRRIRTYTTSSDLKARYEKRQRELMELRARNDENIRSILERKL